MVTSKVLEILKVRNGRSFIEFHKHFTIDQKNRTQDMLEEPDTESIHSISRGPSRARKVFKDTNIVELYQVQTK